MIRRTFFTIFGLALLSAPSSVGAAEAGTVIGWYDILGGKKIEIHSAGPAAGTARPKLDYQCVALIRRYLNAVQPGYGEFERPTNAQEFFRLVASGALPYLEAIPNGVSDRAPQRGDILCMDGGLFGHVALVDRVETAGSRPVVWVKEQNWPMNQFENAIPLFREGATWLVGRDCYRGNLRVQGWCRLREQTVPAMPESTVTRTVCYLVDCSSSMGGEGKIQLARRQLESHFARLAHTDRAACVTFADTPQIGYRLKTVADVHRDGGANLITGGLTNIGLALEVAIRVLGEVQGAEVVLITDGQNKAGDLNAAVEAFAKAKQAQNWRFTVIGIGADQDRSRLETLVQRTGGTYIPVTR